MDHPFDLDAAQLEAINFGFEETLSADALIDLIGGAIGGIIFTTLAMGEEGGDCPIDCISAPCPGSEGGGGGFPVGPIFEPPMTTMAMGEEGGDPPMTTMAIGEEGGGPIPW
jgi:hypothetical protein